MDGWAFRESIYITRGGGRTEWVLVVESGNSTGRGLFQFSTKFIYRGDSSELSWYYWRRRTHFSSFTTNVFFLFWNNFHSKTTKSYANKNWVLISMSLKESPTHTIYPFTSLHWRRRRSSDPSVVPWSFYGLHGGFSLSCHVTAWEERLVGKGGIRVKERSSGVIQWNFYHSLFLFPASRGQLDPRPGWVNTPVFI